MEVFQQQVNPKGEMTDFSQMCNISLGPKDSQTMTVFFFPHKRRPNAPGEHF